MVQLQNSTLKTVHRHYGVLHKSTLQNSVFHYFQKGHIFSRKRITSGDTEEKSTNPWTSWVLSLTLPNPGND